MCEKKWKQHIINCVRSVFFFWVKLPQERPKPNIWKQWMNKNQKSCRAEKLQIFMCGCPISFNWLSIIMFHIVALIFLKADMLNTLRVAMFIQLSFLGSCRWLIIILLNCYVWCRFHTMLTLWKKWINVKQVKRFRYYMHK